jgi:hypothetical protein
MLTLIIVRSRRLVSMRGEGVVRLPRVVARVVVRHGRRGDSRRLAHQGGDHRGPADAGRHIITAYSALAPFAAPLSVRVSDGSAAGSDRGDGVGRGRAAASE